jgi:thermostable 8-oxoguanine DNA glycosylase
MKGREKERALKRYILFPDDYLEMETIQKNYFTYKNQTIIHLDLNIFYFYQANNVGPG